MKRIRSDDFRVMNGEALDLARRSTRVAPLYQSKKGYRKLLQKKVEDLADLQRRLYASNRYSLLLILQGMDAAGKDGVIRHVLSGINPQGCQVFSFKQPSAEELDHDFLWRTAKHLPERGRIGVFNRSYYEEVLVVRVHPEYLAAQQLPEGTADGSAFWSDRFKSICEHEAHLVRNGTRVVKVFLHLSKDEQRQRFLDRIDEADKNWKFSLGDVNERKFWDAYQRAFEESLSATSTVDSPWYVVPADDKLNSRLIVAQILRDTLAALRMEYPSVSAARRKELALIRKGLTK